MTLINTQIKPFQATAFKQGEFVEVSDADMKGNRSTALSYSALSGEMYSVPQL